MSTETTWAAQVSLEAARDAMAELTPNLTKLLRSVPDPAAPAVGTWTAGEVAAHLAHVVGLDLEADRGPGAENALKAVGVARDRAPRWRAFRSRADRGGSRGVPVEQPGRPPDVSDPAVMLLSILGRGGSRLARVLSGRIVAWGPPPDARPARVRRHQG